MISSTERVFNNRWKWTRIEMDSEEDITQLSSRFTELAVEDSKWVQTMRRHDSSYIRSILLPSNENIVFGSLMYERNELEEDKSYKVFHYYVTDKNLYTINLKLSDLSRTNEKRLYSHMDSCDTATEGIMLLVGEIVDSFFRNLDDFERKLMDLETEVHENNSTETLERIYQRRYELLGWSNLLLPVMEFRYAVEEAFLDVATETTVFKRLVVRIQRITELIENYKDEIDTLFTIDTSISSYRGNEIMKTLTVFTVIVTPSMALGALWGMNFKMMPELEWRLGYLFALILIGVSTLVIYFWLRYKGWTGDILKTKKKKSHLK